MREQISRFLGQKNLSANSIKSYTYDLGQFLDLVQEHVNPSKLQVYETFLTGLSPAARRRKLSAVNQFLHYLYNQGLLDQFYDLTVTDKQTQHQKVVPLLDLSAFWQKTDLTSGQLLALLISHLGLTPSELTQLKVEDINRDFQVLTIRKGDLVRVLALPSELLPYLTWEEGATYLFDRKGQPFSRQWVFQTLSTYLEQLGLGHLSAQKLREQYILQEFSKGRQSWELAKQLGLKTTATLDKYDRHGY